MYAFRGNRHYHSHRLIKHVSFSLEQILLAMEDFQEANAQPWDQVYI
jgi:hypothetical protein